MDKIIKNIKNISGYLNPDYRTIENIINLQDSVLSSTKDVVITFNGCKFISPIFLAVLGGLTKLGEESNISIKLDLDTIDDKKVEEYMRTSGFVNYLNPDLKINLSNANAIAFKKFELDDFSNDEIIYKYINEIINLIPINMSEDLKNEMIGKIYEIFANAFEHSNSGIGLYCCGHFFPRKNELYFCVYDGGVGIPQNVRLFHENKNIESDEALKWAFKAGNTTATEVGFPRGLGLDFLKNFIKLNNGYIKIYSNDSHGDISKADEIYSNMNKNLVGTLFIMKVNADFHHYYLI